MATPCNPLGRLLQKAQNDNNLKIFVFWRKLKTTKNPSLRINFLQNRMLIHCRIYFTRNLSSQAKKNKRVLRVATRHSVAIKHLLCKHCKSFIA